VVRVKPDGLFRQFFLDPFNLSKEHQWREKKVHYPKRSLYADKSLEEQELNYLDSMEGQNLKLLILLFALMVISLPICQWPQHDVIL
jgi:hypothetical protein